MKRGTRLFFVLFFLAMNCLTAIPVLCAQDLTTLTVTITGFPSSNGKAMVALYNSADSYEGSGGTALANEKAGVEGQTAQVVFKNMPYGWYGVSMFHDENENGKMDKNLMGAPKEAYGFSNSAKGQFGKPGFEDIKFQLDSPVKEITINLK